MHVNVHVHAHTCTVHVYVPLLKSVFTLLAERESPNMVRELTRPRRLVTSPHSFWMFVTGVMIKVGPNAVESESFESSEIEPEELFLIRSLGEIETGGVGWRRSRDGAVDDQRDTPYPIQTEVKVYMRALWNYDINFGNNLVTMK